MELSKGEVGGERKGQRNREGFMRESKGEAMFL